MILRQAYGHLFLECNLTGFEGYVKKGNKRIITPFTGIRQVEVQEGDKLTKVVNGKKSIFLIKNAKLKKL